MSSTTPSTPEAKAPARPIVAHRSFTVPAKVSNASSIGAPAEIGAKEGLKTLFSIPHARVVKFTTPAGAKEGTLSWTSSMEQTMAVGPLEVYNVPGMTSFLHSGTLLHAILRRTNCWCVDGAHTFAMRVLPFTYYRIELPNETTEDLAKIEDFTAVLSTVLYYERTPCPFARDFVVELPEEKVIKKKRRSQHGPAKKWKLGRANSWKPEDGADSAEGEDLASSQSEESDGGKVTSRVRFRPIAPLPDQPSPSRLHLCTPTKVSVKDRIQGLTSASRSFTSPPQLDLRTGYSAVEPAVRRLEEATEHEKLQAALRSTIMSGRRSLQSVPTDMPPSPPDSSAGPEPLDQVVEQDEEMEELNDDAFEGDNSVIHTAENGDESIPDFDLDQNQHDLQNNGQLSDPTQDLEELLNSLAAHDIMADEDTHLQDESVVEPLSNTSPRATSEEDVQKETPVHPITPNAEQLTTEQASIPIDQTQPPDNFMSATATSESPDYLIPTTTTAQPPDDPFVQIHSRIQARRSIGGTISFHPTTHSPLRQPSSASFASSSTSNTSTSTTSSASTLSRQRRRPLQSAAQHQALTTALVKKAYTVFLGPPAYLVAIMLRIAARFADGKLGDVMGAWTAGTSSANSGVKRTEDGAKVPGSFDLEGSDVEDFMDGSEVSDGEDDFGVPLDSPIRLVGRERELRRRVLGRSGLRDGEM